MTDKQKHEIIEAIAYSRLVSNTFSPAECILLHQWRNGRYALGLKLIEKYKSVRIKIDASKWHKPELKYVEGGDLFQQCPVRLTWKKVEK